MLPKIRANHLRQPSDNISSRRYQVPSFTIPPNTEGFQISVLVMPMAVVLGSIIAQKDVSSGIKHNSKQDCKLLERRVRREDQDQNRCILE
jgi:hypothetical protein